MCLIAGMLAYVLPVQYHTVGEDEPIEDDDEVLSEGTSQAKLHRKVVAQAFWNSEVEEELRERRWLDVRFSTVRSREEVMEAVDRERAVSVCQDSMCSDECQRRYNTALDNQN